MATTGAPPVDARLAFPRILTLAVDMKGCLNRCRHCYLGQASRARLSADDVRWAASELRRYTRPGASTPHINHLTVSTWLREPDHTTDFRALYALEDELSDGPPQRFELLSVRRLAHDPGYARWAAEIGTTACQVTFFVTGDTQDWFHRRKGAWEDSLAATERLLEVGIRPRWQLFITRRLLPELDELLALARSMGVWQRAEQTPGLFAHLPTPDGEAQQLEDLRPTFSEIDALPKELLEDSQRWLGRSRLWDTEEHWVKQLLTATPKEAQAYPVPQRLALYLLPNWDVYSNMGTLEPWWRLGNLMTEGTACVVERYCQARPLGMRLALCQSRAELALAYGDRAGQRVYGSADDLLTRYIGQRGETLYDASDPYGERT